MPIKYFSKVLQSKLRVFIFATDILASQFALILHKMEFLLFCERKKKHTNNVFPHLMPLFKGQNVHMDTLYSEKIGFKNTFLFEV